MKNKTILFFPLESGLAHITRSLAVGEYLHHKGYRVVFAVPKNKQQLFKNSPVEFVDINPFFPFGITVSTIHKSVDIVRDPAFVQTLITRDLELIDHYKPSVIVVDARYSAIGAGHIRNIKTVLLGGTFTLEEVNFHIPNPGIPSGAYFILKLLALRAVKKIKKDILDAVLKAIHHWKPGAHIDDMFTHLNYIVPEKQSYFLPCVTANRPVHFVGSLFWEGFEYKKPSWIKKIRRDGKTVYISFGGTGIDSKKMVEIIQKLLDNGFRVVTNSSIVVDSKDFPKHPNLFHAQFLPGTEICKRVDVVICHGGHGTLMQAVLTGAPTISIPFNPDQLLHAFRFQELGLGICSLKITTSFILDVATGNVNRLLNHGSFIKSEHILKDVSYILENKQKFDTAIKQFNREQLPLTGIVKAAEVIENLAV